MEKKTKKKKAEGEREKGDRARERESYLSCRGGRCLTLDGDEREIMRGKKALGFFLAGREGD